MAEDDHGKTLWNLFAERFLHQGNGNGAAFALSNPLDWRIGEAERLAPANGEEYLDHAFTVQEIREYVRRLGDHEFGFTDYVLRGMRPGGKEGLRELSVRVRAIPQEKGRHELLLLRLEDEFAFAGDFLAVVKDPTGIFEVKEDETGAVETFTRLNELREPWEAAVLIVTATTAEGKAPPGSVERAKLEYWDYGREVTQEDGRKVAEYLFVEQNGETGWFQIWRGREFFV